MQNDDTGNGVADDQVEEVVVLRLQQFGADCEDEEQAEVQQGRQDCLWDKKHLSCEMHAGIREVGGRLVAAVGNIPISGIVHN